MLKHNSDHVRAAKELGLPVSLVDRQLAFVAALRTAGLTVSVAEGLDAAHAATAIELADREQFRAALAATLVKRQLHRPAFDRLFDIYYPPLTGLAEAAAADVAVPGSGLDNPVRDRIRADLAGYLRDGDDGELRAVARAAVTAFGAVPSRAAGRPGWSRLSVLDRVSAQTLMAGLLANFLAGEQRGGLAEQRARTLINDRIARFESAVEAEVRRRIGGGCRPGSRGPHGRTAHARTRQHHGRDPRRARRAAPRDRPAGPAAGRAPGNGPAPRLPRAAGLPPDHPRVAVLRRGARWQRCTGRGVRSRPTWWCCATSASR